MIDQLVGELLDIGRHNHSKRRVPEFNLTTIPRLGSLNSICRALLRGPLLRVTAPLSAALPRALLRGPLLRVTAPLSAPLP
jgi:hypothetical protein